MTVLKSLLSKLQESGFEWQKWPAGKKKKRDAILPYVPGQQKLWFSTKDMPLKAYMLALLGAEALRSFLRAQTRGHNPCQGMVPCENSYGD